MCRVAESDRFMCLCLIVWNVVGDAKIKQKEDLSLHLAELAPNITDWSEIVYDCVLLFTVFIY